MPKDPTVACVYTVVPSQETWDVGDRQGLCLAGLSTEEGTFVPVEEPLGGNVGEALSR